MSDSSHPRTDALYNTLGDVVWLSTHLKMLKFARILEKENERLRAQLRRASCMADEAPELNMSNYDEGQVDALNTAMTELCLFLRTARGEEKT